MPLTDCVKLKTTPLTLDSPAQMSRMDCLLPFGRPGHPGGIRDTNSSGAKSSHDLRFGVRDESQPLSPGLFDLASFQDARFVYPYNAISLFPQEIFLRG